MLHDYGAEVIKVEQPGTGDSGRGARGRDGFQHYAEAMNRGKKSIEIDLRNKDSREILERLVKWADVVAENFKPGVMDRLGYGYEFCKQVSCKAIS
jgi:crotonobetainyl-CoA:carnitine CoA-transferase CaiB-like acyl-CoA transferase